MRWSIPIFVLFLLGAGGLPAQEIIISPSNFVEYHRGTLPIVIAVPNGGNISPDSIPNRNCNNPNFEWNSNTIEAALAISKYLEKSTGCYPHLIINRLHRKKVECNRKKILGTCYQPVAEQVWDEYHQYVDSALLNAGLENDGNKFLIDLIGHNHDIQRIELGYLIPGIDLQSSNPILDLDDPINQTSVEHLIDDNIGNLRRSQLVRGSRALGSFLNDKDFPAVPSNRFLFPFNTTEYLKGTYTTERYSNSELDGGVVAIQAALNFEGVRDDEQNVQKFGSAFASSMISFVAVHRGQILINCGIEKDPDHALNEFDLGDLVLFPNPSFIGNTELNLIGIDVEDKEYKIHNMAGELVGSGIVEDYKVSLSKELAAGMYIIYTWKKNGTIQHTIKFALVRN